MVVCHCLAVNDRRIRSLAATSSSVADITSHCGAGGDCGSCIGRIDALLAEHKLGHTSAVRID